MENKIFNIYINSTYKNNGDTNYDYKLFFSNYNIHINPDEECHIYLKSFQTINTFYNINSNSNTFSIIINENRILQETPIVFTMDVGNYNCYEFMDAINNLASNYFTMSYNVKQNTFTYTQNPALVDKTVYIICNQYNHKYFGLPMNTRNSLFNPLVSSIINMNYFSLIVIKLFGLVSNNKTIDNFSNNISSSDIFAIVNRQDNIPNSLINFNDYNNTFKYAIQNNNLDYFNFKFLNENNELLTEIQDWLMILQITILKK